jgi:prepilin-type N-terminal cleavage/methylation domain-containing protein
MTHARRGFTVVEIIVVIVLMGILLALAMTRLGGTQVAARDDAIKKEAESVARGLEEYYKVGNPNYSVAAGSYPSTDEFRHASGENVPAIGTQVTGGYLDSWLEGVRLPVASKIRLITMSGQTPENSTNINNSTPAGVITYEPLVFTPASGPDPDRFTFCTSKTSQCNKFNIYYRNEQSDIVRIIKSEKQ